jgi:nicotinamide-nucleotide amidase
VRIEEEVGRLLREKGLTVAVAESCTGGMIGQRLTSVSGSSGYFLGGVIAYSNALKLNLLDVAPETIEKEGAVSEATARQMAAGVMKALGADIGLSITGIAGPEGGTEAKPVGLVFVGLASAAGCGGHEFRFEGNRDDIRQQGCQNALRVLKEDLRKQGVKHGQETNG